MGPKKPTDQETLRQLAAAVADGQQVDWSAVTDDPELAAKLHKLRVIENISQLYHSASERVEVNELADCKVENRAAADAHVPPPRAPKSKWGEHVLLERVGCGSFGDVYRAYDPSLRRHVAIKLLRRERAHTDAQAERLLDEARRLARVRHPNVITVHGVETHDGESGIRTELLEGRTLEECIHSPGVFSAREAALVGSELCGALAAIHAQNIVHGDVKTTNVIRENGGRIVLMDFGSAREDHARAEVGRDVTPLATPPEVLHGERPGRAADVYQLGVLLYRLVTGRYPVESNDLEVLRAKLDAGDIVPLRDRRPNLPSTFVRVVSRAMQRDPRARFASVGEMEEALQATIHPARERVGSGSRARTLWAALATLAVVVVAAWALGRLPFTRPLQLDARLYRVGNGAREPLDPENADPLRPGDSLALTVESREDVHVYVLNEAGNQPGVLNTLFPDPDLSVHNPVAGGTVHMLPSGSLSEASWEVSGTSGVERLLIIAARQPLSEIEAHVSLAGSSPGFFDVDPQKLEDLGLRSIELRKKGASDGGSAFRYLEHVLAQKQQEGDVWYRLVQLDCEAATNSRQDRDREKAGESR